MENKNEQSLEVELSPEIAEGTYANLAVITHSESEFIMDFIRMMPNAPKAKVQSRIILTPDNAKRLLFALQENMAKYEKQYGQIRSNTQTLPPMLLSGEA